MAPLLYSMTSIMIFFKVGFPMKGTYISIGRGDAFISIFILDFPQKLQAYVNIALLKSKGQFLTQPGWRRAKLITFVISR